MGRPDPRRHREKAACGISADGPRLPLAAHQQGFTLKDVIGVLRESDSPVVTAKKVGETLDCSAEAARQKLLELRDQGSVARRQVGAGAVVWWLIADEPTPEEIRDIDPDDPLFTGNPLLAPEDPVDETEIDDVLYGED